MVGRRPFTLRLTCSGAGRSGSRIPLQLVEVAQRRSAGADPGPQGAQLVVRDLAEGALDAEVGQAQIILVDDRRDPGIDLVPLLADERDREHLLDPALAD